AGDVAAVPYRLAAPTASLALSAVAHRAISCVWWPAARVSTILFVPQRISVRKGVREPNGGAWMSPVAAVVWQMPSAHVLTTTASCCAVPGAMICWSAPATRAKATAAQRKATRPAIDMGDLLC